MSTSGGTSEQGTSGDSGSVRLHVTSSGESGPRVAFCHGLFGQGRNWTQVAKGLTDIARPTLIDMPNHGRSGWTERHDYVAAADIVADTLADIDGDEPWALVGHSMGGKIAMLLALRRPELVERLCVVDVSPVGYREGREFETYVAGMRAMDLTAIETREEADAALTEAAPDPGVRGFLLQNLRRDGDGWRWQMNLDVLGDSIDLLRDWPGEAVEGASYDGPTLWVGGSDSGYVRDEFAEAMRGYFPRVRQLTVKDAGHWVHSQQPEVFLATMRAFLQA